MNTLAHIAVAAAALSRPQMPERNKAILAGALLPDLSMFVFFAWSRIQGWTGAETWSERYWMEPWQSIGAISNSFILFGLVAAVAAWRKWPLISIICVAALIHIALDFPLHADDAHRHFWPLSDWRFFSPISYWDPGQNGLWGSAIETLLGLTAALVLWLRFDALRVRIVVAIYATFQSLSFAMALNWAL